MSPAADSAWSVFSVSVAPLPARTDVGGGCRERTDVCRSLALRVLPDLRTRKLSKGLRYLRPQPRGLGGSPEVVLTSRLVCVCGGVVCEVGGRSSFRSPGPQPSPTPISSFLAFYEWPLPGLGCDPNPRGWEQLVLARGSQARPDLGFSPLSAPGKTGQEVGSEPRPKLGLGLGSCSLNPTPPQSMI